MYLCRQQNQLIFITSFMYLWFKAKATNWWMLTLIKSKELIISLSRVLICGKYIARLSHTARLPLVSNGSVIRHLKKRVKNILKFIAVTQNSTFLFAQQVFNETIWWIPRTTSRRIENIDRTEKYTPKLQQIMIISAVIYHHIIYDKRNV